jgi:large subunit ribosomal protein L22
MEIKAEQKYMLISPKKVRPLADLVKKMSPVKALEVLPFTGQRGWEVLAKVIKGALAGARERGLSEDSLKFKEIQIGEGPRLKRGRPVSRGQWHPFKRRMSHIKVVLTTVKVETKEKKEEGKEEKKTEKIEVKEVKAKSKKEVKKN